MSKLQKKPQLSWFFTLHIDCKFFVCCGVIWDCEATANGFQGSGSGVPKLNIAQGPRKVRTSSGF